MAGVPTFENTAASLTLTTGFEIELTPGTANVVTDIQGWTKPASMRRTKTERAGAHGTFSERGLKDERLISVSGHFYAPSRAEAAAFTDRMAALLADGDEGLFTVNDADLGERWAKVYLSGDPDVVWEGGTDVFFTIDLSAPDPRKYGHKVITSTGIPTDGGGLAFDLFAGQPVGIGTPGILDFGPTGNPGTASFTNVGTADSAALLKVEGFAPGFTITEVESGRRLVYTAEVLKGQYLILNPNDATVKLNGYADRSEFLTIREWTRTEGGKTSTFFFQTDGPNARLTVEGVPAWW